MVRPNISVDIDVPDGVDITHHRRVGSLNFFEVTSEWPDVYQCEKCGHRADDAYEILDVPRFVRDVDMFGMPCYCVYKVVIFRCKRCHSRQHVIPPSAFMSRIGIRRRGFDKAIANGDHPISP